MTIRRTGADIVRAYANKAGDSNYARGAQNQPTSKPKVMIKRRPAASNQHRPNLGGVVGAHMGRRALGGVGAYAGRRIGSAIQRGASKFTRSLASKSLSGLKSLLSK